MLLHLYFTGVKSEDSKLNGDVETPLTNGRANGHVRPSGVRAFDGSDRAVRDAEEFELEGLISDDEPDSPRKAER